MNRVGLCAYYQVEDWEEAEALLEDEIFALKQHFISKPWLALTAKSRLKKLKDLSVYFDTKEVEFDYPELKKTDSVLEWWKNYQQLVLWGKQQIMIQDSPADLFQLIKSLFERAHQFFSQVPDLPYSKEEPVFGTDPDPMFVQKEIMALNSRGISTFAEIFEQRATISNGFLLVCKRWSMLVKYL